MQIANTVLSELIEGLRAAPVSDLRAAPRTPVHIKVNVTIVETNGSADHAGHTYSAITRDISLTGLGLFQNAALIKNQRLLITLPRKDATPLTLRCTVMHCQPLADGIFGIGAQIDNVIGQGDSTSGDRGSGRGRKLVGAPGR